MTVESSKLTGYAILSPNVGVSSSKLTGYAVLSPNVGVSSSKLTGYAILQENPQFILDIALTVPFQEPFALELAGPETVTLTFDVEVPFQQPFDLALLGSPTIDFAMTVPFQEPFDLAMTTPAGVMDIALDVPFQPFDVVMGPEAEVTITIDFEVPFQQPFDLAMTGDAIIELIIAALLSKIGSHANFGGLMDPGPIAFASQLTCIQSEL